MRPELIVSEIFGPTIQGEGPSLGRRAVFLRLGICNLKCSWCDTKYTWDWENYDYRKELMHLEPEIIRERLKQIGTGFVVVTGGEPLLQRDKLYPLINRLHSRDSWRVEVETAGTIHPYQLVSCVDQFNVSPKLSNSGNPLEKRYNLDVLRSFASLPTSYFKFVVTCAWDLLEVDKIVRDARITNDKVYIMPEGRDSATINSTLRNIAEDTISRGWNLTTRLHIELWGGKRGV